MKKKALILVGVILIAAALVGRSVLKRSVETSPAAPSELDPADVADQEERQKKEYETLYGETYLDDMRVTIVNGKFEPETITVKAGTTIIWTNQDTVARAVVVENGAETPEIPPGKEGAIIFRLAGTYTYHFGNDNSAIGTVVVE